MKGYQQNMIYGEGILHAIFLSMLWFLSSALSLGSGYPNDVDSLRQILQKNNRGELILDDTTKAWVYQKLSYEMRHNKTDSSIYYTKRALDFIDKYDIPRLEAKLYKNLSRFYYLKGEYDLSLLNARKAHVIYRGLNDLKNLSACLTSEGLVYAVWDEHEEALELFRESISLAQSANQKSQEAATLYDMGISHKALNNVDQAISYFQQSIDIYEALNDSVYLARNYFFIAEIYTDQHKFSEAKELFLKSIDFLDEDNYWDLAFANAGIARLYNKMENPEEATQYAEKGYKYALDIDAKWELQRVTKILANSYALQSNYEKAYDYQLKHTIYHEEVFNQTREQNLARIELAREASKNELLRSQNKQQLASLNSTRYVIIMLIMLITFVLTLIFMLFRNSKEIKNLNDQLTLKNSFIREARKNLEVQNQELKELNETKNKILSVISHDARSPISSLQGLLNYVENEDLPHEEFKMLLNSIRNNLQQTSQMFDNMLKWAKSQFRTFEPVPETVQIYSLVNSLIKECEEVYSKKGISVYNYVGKSTCVYTDPEMMRVVFRNILSNALKFCDEGDTVTFKDQILDHKVRIYAIDTGIGISEEQINLIKSNKKFTRVGTQNESGSGFGLTICQDFIDLNNGRFDMEGEPGKGTSIIIELPKSEKMKSHPRLSKNYTV